MEDPASCLPLLPTCDEDADNFFAALTTHLNTKERGINVQVDLFYAELRGMEATMLEEVEKNTNQVLAELDEVDKLQQQLNDLKGEQLEEADREHQRKLKSMEEKRKELALLLQQKEELNKQYKEKTSKFQEHKALMEKKLDALKAAAKTYSMNLQMKLELDPKSEVINVIFTLPKNNEENVDYAIKLKSVGEESFDIVDAPKELESVVEEFHNTKNVQKLLCNVREYALEFVTNN